MQLTAGLFSRYMVRALDQRTSQIDVDALGDAELRIAIARLTASWSQTEIATSLPTSLETQLVAQRQGEGESGDVADTLHLQQRLRVGILRLR